MNSDQYTSGVIMFFYCAFIIGVVALAIAVWWRIFSKAGFSGVLGLLMLVPLVNLFMILFLAFSEWPIERENRALRGNTYQTSYPETDSKYR